MNRLIFIPCVTLAFALGVSSDLSHATREGARCSIASIQQDAPSDTVIFNTSWVTAPVPHCEVSGFVTSNNPGPNRINFKLVLPDSWEKRYFLAGNGGAGGSIQDDPARYLSLGMAAAAHDTGHRGGGIDWTPMLYDVAKKVDWGFRSEHLIAVATQHITRSFYGVPETEMFRYFRGCSKGGGQAANLLQNYPGDFDGIVAGTSGVYDVPLMHAAIGRHILSASDHYVSPAKLRLLENAVLAACDDLDGIRDGIVTDPRVCPFRPEVLQCEDGNGSDCLTEGELSTIDLILGGLEGPSGQEIYPGYSITNASDWAPILTGLEPPDLTSDRPWADATAPQSLYVPERIMRHFYFDDPSYDFVRSFDPVNPASIARFREMDRAYNAQIANPNIQPFRDTGGKVLFWAGWSDNSLSPYAMVRYYDELVERNDGNLADLQEFARLFMAPGVLHCGRGPGPQDVPDRALNAMISWVEQGIAPQSITASRPETASLAPRSFRLCPYPQSARYISGDPHDATNWQCADPVSPEI
jgi:feruloyl esterase